jgi:hypothetical protein
LYFAEVCQELAHLCIARLAEVFVPGADRLHPLWLNYTDLPVDERRKNGEGFWRRHGHSEHHQTRLLFTDSDEGGSHCRSGGKAVVDDDRRTSKKRHSGAWLGVQLLLPSQFDPRVGNQFFNLVGAKLEGFYDVAVEHPHSARSDRTHSKLLMTRSTDLAYRHGYERSAEPARHFGAHRHATSGQCHYHRAWKVLARGQPFAKRSTCVSAIEEEARLQRRSVPRALLRVDYNAAMVF